MRRRLWIGLLIVLLCCSAGSEGVVPSVVYADERQPQHKEVVYVGSARSNKYHYPWCRWAKKINPENLVSFSSPEDARRQGYVPCKVCHPPLRSAR